MFAISSLSFACLAASAVWLVVAAAGSGVHQAGTAASKAVRERIGVVDTSPAPPTLRAWYTRSTSIVLIRVERLDVREIVRPMDIGEIRDVFSDCTATVLEVFKAVGDAGAPLTNGQAIVVRTLGAEVDRGTFIERHRIVGAASLAAGRRYVTALVRWGEVWTPEWGDQAVFDVTSDSVSPQGSSRLDRAQGGRPSADLLAALRGLRPTRVKAASPTGSDPSP